MNPERIKSQIVAGIRAAADTAVIGLSGGADSLLVTLLCRDALGPEQVYTYSFPYGAYDHEHFNKNSRRWAEHLDVNHGAIPVTEAVTALNGSLAAGLGLEAEADLSRINAGNARSRVRMCLLYGLAHHLAGELGRRVRVAGTGNLSEDFIGYDTKGGDALADFFPIGELLKSEVYAMLEHYRDAGVIEEAMINRKPSAGLWEGQTDEAEIGYTYAEMEPAVRYLWVHRELPGDGELPAVYRFVWQRHLANRHKHQAPPVIGLRDAEGNLP